jgi:hypothetical protein
VAGFAALGHANKLIAWEMGLAPSTVAAHLATAQRKLGVSSRLELVGLVGRFSSPEHRCHRRNDHVDTAEMTMDRSTTKSADP